MGGDLNHGDQAPVIMHSEQRGSVFVNRPYDDPVVAVTLFTDTVATSIESLPSGTGGWTDWDDFINSGEHE